MTTSRQQEIRVGTLLNRRPTTGTIAKLFVLVLMLCHSMASPRRTYSQVVRQSEERIQALSRDAALALKNNDPTAATQAYRAILTIDPKNTDARANLGVIAFVQGDWAGAAKEFRKAILIRPFLWKAKTMLGFCELHQGHESEGAKLLSESFPHLDEPKIRLEAGLDLVDLWYQHGELAKASALIADLRELYPEDIAVLYAAYRIYSDQTYEAIDSMALIGADSAQFHLALAEHLVSEGHLDGAINEYQKSIDRNPDIAGPHYELGEAILQQSHLEPELTKAQKEFERALALNHEDTRSECELGKVELWRANSDGAFEHFSRAQKMSSRVVSCAYLGLAELLINAEKIPEALVYLQAAVEADPYDPDVRWRLANVYRRLGRKEDADRESTAFQKLKQVRGDLQKAYQEAPQSK